MDHSYQPPLTERRNPRSTHLDRMSSLEIATLMNEEDKHVVEAVRHALPDISKAMELFAKKYAEGANIFYIGAGSSGRYAILDMAELPPTFGVDPRQFKGLMAGGPEAMYRAKENSEDDEEAARKDLEEAGMKKGDLLIGLAASGQTPYVLSGMKKAKEEGALTISISCVEEDKIGEYADIPIRLLCGPEILTGSTRLKAGTAEKMVLNMISTGAFVLCGKVYENLMVDLIPSNSKLVKRETRIVQEATGTDEEEAEKALRECSRSAKEAIVMIKLGCDAESAKLALKKAGGFVRKAIKE